MQKSLEGERQKSSKRLFQTESIDEQPQDQAEDAGQRPQAAEGADPRLEEGAAQPEPPDDKDPQEEISL